MAGDAARSIGPRGEGERAGDRADTCTCNCSSCKCRCGLSTAAKRHRARGHPRRDHGGGADHSHVTCTLRQAQGRLCSCNRTLRECRCGPAIQAGVPRGAEKRPDGTVVGSVRPDQVPLRRRGAGGVRRGDVDTCTREACSCKCHPVPDGRDPRANAEEIHPNAVTTAFKIVVPLLRSDRSVRLPSIPALFNRSLRTFPA